MVSIGMKRIFINIRHIVAVWRLLFHLLNLNTREELLEELRIVSCM